jgi:hypothetical protein
MLDRDLKGSLGDTTCMYCFCMFELRILLECVQWVVKSLTN